MGLDTLEDCYNVTYAEVLDPFLQKYTWCSLVFLATHAITQSHWPVKSAKAMNISSSTNIIFLWIMLTEISTWRAHTGIIYWFIGKRTHGVEYGMGKVLYKNKSAQVLREMGNFYSNHNWITLRFTQRTLLGCFGLLIYQIYEQL